MPTPEQIRPEQMRTAVRHALGVMTVVYHFVEPPS